MAHPEARNYLIRVGSQKELIVALAGAVPDLAEPDSVRGARLEVGERLIESAVFQADRSDVLGPSAVDLDQSGMAVASSHTSKSAPSVSATRHP